MYVRSAARLSDKSNLGYYATAATDIFTLSLHDALPICRPWKPRRFATRCLSSAWQSRQRWVAKDRKSTRLNSSHRGISYAVFCLTKKKVATTVIAAGGVVRQSLA